MSVDKAQSTNEEHIFTSLTMQRQHFEKYISIQKTQTNVETLLVVQNTMKMSGQH